MVHLLSVLSRGKIMTVKASMNNWMDASLARRWRNALKWALRCVWTTEKQRNQWTFRGPVNEPLAVKLYNETHSNHTWASEVDQLGNTKNHRDQGYSNILRYSPICWIILRYFLLTNEMPCWLDLILIELSETIQTDLATGTTASS